MSSHARPQSAANAVRPPSFWEAVPARQATLERLAAARLSATAIAAVLGCTRNAVIGRAWRTGVQLKGLPIASDPAAAGRAAAAARRLNPIHLPRDRSAAA